MPIVTDATFILPDDFADAALMGRIWRPDLASPSVVAIRNDGVFDITDNFPTASQLAGAADPAGALRAARGERLGALQDLLTNTPPENRDPTKPWLLAPIDLQVIKAAGVTFAVSMLERVIEERARGNPESATAIRAEVTRIVGTDLSRLKPGSAEAQHVKDVLVAQNAWSQYLEVGIGPDAEVFTKAPVLSAVGTCTDAGLHPKSVWNNPEPEVVLVVASDGRIVGASLGNDVNLRDFEGRSALLLSKAKDNNASCAIGPFVRFFDAGFGLDDVRTMEISLEVKGPEGFVLHGASSLTQISRDPVDIVAQTINENHQYPDGFVLFLGTMFAPIQDRAAKGQGFTHVEGDLVTVATSKLGRLTNRMRPSGACEPWAFGLTALIAALTRRIQNKSK
ncbi:MAG: fumarylacetoacetate hydrolase family protein [Alphaproteobacteria bacterium]|nr:MAG: fumarylacetoacetate hydrolase family protein [Alphaproteobacteria bacterium]